MTLNTQPLTLSLLSFLLPLQSAYAEQLFIGEGQPAQLIELYTSEGCSSCPPADQYLSTLKHTPELWQKVVPLAFHVDYWDYLGWKDPFAQTHFKQRQYNYQKHGRSGGIYTPGWFINGKEWRGFFQRKAIPSNTAAKGGKLLAKLNANTLTVHYQTEKKHKNLTINVALLGFDQFSQIHAGENRGRSLNHQFVVLHKAHKTNKIHDWKFTLPPWNRSKQHALAIWVHSTDLVPIQVAAGWIKNI